MITSERNFGVEIEFFCKTLAGLRKINSSIPIIEDGSIRHIEYAREYVSEILNGSSGERTIQNVCEVLKKNGASGDEPSMSVHIHLDGKNKGGELRSSKVRPDDTKSRIIAISNRLKSETSMTTIRSMVKGEWYFGGSAGSPKTKRFNDDNVIYISSTLLLRKPKLNYTYYWIEKPDRYKWLKNMMYFYTMFSPVIEDMVSNSRRYGNMYCIPLHKSYDLDKIEATKNMEELKNLWYKGRSSNGHYDDSRYHNINFHCFWDRHGTVEVRSHGGTVESNKILLWLKLHQKIADKLETMELNDIKFTGNLHEEFVKFIEEPLLQEYVKRLLGYYSGIKIK